MIIRVVSVVIQKGYEGGVRGGNMHTLKKEGAVVLVPMY